MIYRQNFTEVPNFTWMFSSPRNVEQISKHFETFRNIRKSRGLRVLRVLGYVVYVSLYKGHVPTLTLALALAYSTCESLGSLETSCCRKQPADIPLPSLVRMIPKRSLPLSTL